MRCYWSKTLQIIQMGILKKLFNLAQIALCLTLMYYQESNFIRILKSGIGKVWLSHILECQELLKTSMEETFNFLSTRRITLRPKKNFWKFSYSFTINAHRLWVRWVIQILIGFTSLKNLNCKRTKKAIQFTMKT